MNSLRTEYSSIAQLASIDVCQDHSSELVIDEYDQWSNPQGAMAILCRACRSDASTPAAA